MSERLALWLIRPLLTSLWGALFLSIVAAPYFATHSHPGLSSFLYLAFSPMCHQLPARCFTLMGASWAVCQRCSGIYFGLLVGSILPRMDFASSPRRRKFVLAATASLALDALMPLSGVWGNTQVSRSASGFLFGIALSMVFLEGLAELLPGRLRCWPARSSKVEGVMP